MPLSAVELCAAALVKIGARPFAAFEEDDGGGRVRAPPVPDRPRSAAGPASLVLHARPGAALGRAQPPLADFAAAFTLPADHLRTISVGIAGRGRGVAYRIQGERLLCDAGEIVLSYQRRVARGRAARVLRPPPGDPAGG